MKRTPDALDAKREEVVSFRAPELLVVRLKEEAHRLGLRSTSFLICDVMSAYARKQPRKRLRGGEVA